METNLAVMGLNQNSKPAGLKDSKTLSRTEESRVTMLFTMNAVHILQLFDPL